MQGGQALPIVGDIRDEKAVSDAVEGVVEEFGDIDIVVNKASAINLPYEFVDEAEEVLPDKRAEIVVYCMNEECEVSREEARELQEIGYRHVLHYVGGKQGWLKAGLPLEGGRHCA